MKRTTAKMIGASAESCKGFSASKLLDAAEHWLREVRSAPNNAVAEENAAKAAACLVAFIEAPP